MYLKKILQPTKGKIILTLIFLSPFVFAIAMSAIAGPYTGGVISGTLFALSARVVAYPIAYIFGGLIIYLVGGVVYSVLLMITYVIYYYLLASVVVVIYHKIRKK